MYLKANCMIRGSEAVVIWPKLLAAKFVTGMPLRRLFVILNASARNSILCVSRTWNTLERAVSNCQKTVLPHYLRRRVLPEKRGVSATAVRLNVWRRNHSGTCGILSVLTQPVEG